MIPLELRWVFPTPNQNFWPLQSLRCSWCSTWTYKYQKIPVITVLWGATWEWIPNQEEFLEVVGENTAARTFPGSVTLNCRGGHSWWLQINAGHLTSIIYSLSAPPTGPEAAQKSAKTKHRLFPSYNAQWCQIEALYPEHTQQVCAGLLQENLPRILFITPITITDVDLLPPLGFVYTTTVDNTGGTLKTVHGGWHIKGIDLYIYYTF